MKRPGLWNRLAPGAMLFCMAAGSLHAGSDGKFAKRLSGKYASATSAQLLDINQIECYFHNTARFGMDPGFAAGCYYPRGQRSLTLGFSAGPWFLGTVGDAYRTAVVYYVSDFQPGSILADGTPDDPAREEYRVWKFEKGEEVPPEALRIGCPDRVLGDQMLFSVTNDLGRRDFVPSDPIGVELQQTSFAFGGQDFLENTIFIQYRIIHKGLETLEDAFFALWFDPDIGQSNDDYAGCDTALGLGFVYNGDGWDDQYQTQVPAMGIDFLLGPLVDSSGDTAVMADGSQIPDKRLVPLSAFFVGAYGVSSQMDMPNTAEKLFNLCSGSGTDGSPWLDPTQGNLPTAFPFNGDPFAGTGWLPGSRMRPKDVQMGLAAGPFSFSPGDTLSLLAGLVAGQGVGSLHSIEVMKYWDEHVQLFSENGFQPPVLPEISARAVSGDQSIMLLWDSSGISYSKFGYRFEGFNIWQGVGGNGPWKKIATFDEVNGVTRIWDRILDPSLGMVVSMPVQEGTRACRHFTRSPRTA